MKLIEIGSIQPPPDIAKWLNIVCGGWAGIDIAEWKFNSNGHVDVRGDVVVSEEAGDIDRLPVQFRTVTGKFVCSYTNLITLKGAPYTCGAFDAEHCSKLENSIEHFPMYVSDKIVFDGSFGITSCHNIHKRVRKCRYLKLPNCTHILGCVLIPGLGAMHVAGAPLELNRALNKYLKLPEDQRDLNEFQETLIEMGFGKYARL